MEKDTRQLLVVLGACFGLMILMFTGFVFLILIHSTSTAPLTTTTTLSITITTITTTITTTTTTTTSTTTTTLTDGCFCDGTKIMEYRNGRIYFVKDCSEIKVKRCYFDNEKLKFVCTPLEPVKGECQKHGDRCDCYRKK